MHGTAGEVVPHDACRVVHQVRVHGRLVQHGVSRPPSGLRSGATIRRETGSWKTGVGARNAAASVISENALVLGEVRPGVALGIGRIGIIAAETTSI